MLQPLAAVIATELARVDVPGRAYRGVALPALPLPRLRGLGRELDVAVLPLAMVDGDRAGFVTAALDRTVVVEYPDSSREAVSVERVQVEAEDVRWRGVRAAGWTDNAAVGAEAAARGRAAAARRRGKAPATVTAMR